MKVELENVEAILLERKMEPVKVQEIVKELMQAAEDEKADAKNESGPKPKWEHVIVVNDPDNKLGTEFTGWVVIQQEGQDTGLVLSKLRDACKEANESCRKKKNIIQNFGELFQSLKPKFLKEKGLKIKTKEAVRVLTVNGKML
jgi:predicted glycosyltransferase